MKKLNNHEDATSVITPTLGFYRAEMSATIYKFYLDQDIGEPSYYRELLHCLSTATQNDVIELHINTSGGRLDATEAIIAGIRSTDGLVVGFLTQGYSAGSMIALACHELILNDFSSLMVHEAQYGTGGSHHNILGYAEFSERKLNKLFDDIYEGFLTPEELVKVKEGKELWMVEEEIADRLEKRQEYFKKLLEEQMAEEQPEPEQKQESVKKPRKKAVDTKKEV